MKPSPNSGIRYRVRCENCNWRGEKILPARSAMTLVDKPCGRCKHPAVFAMSPVVVGPR